ncbi:MAG: hypothetical protein AAGL17_04325 [Cyanobacteria bacterium J06576_12]
MMISQKRRKQSITSSSLLLLSFASAFFSRVIDTAGAPATINFVHLAIIPAVGVYIIATARTRVLKQVRAAQGLIFSLLFFLFTIVASALLNKAGLINVVLSFLLWVEAYIFLCALVSLPFNSESLDKIKTWVLRFSIFHVGLALLQKVLLEAGVMRATKMGILQDNIQGVFYLSGGGHVIGASVSIIFAIYCVTQPKLSLPFKVIVLIASLTQLVVADAKQVLLVAFVAWFLLILTKVADVKKVLIYGALAAVSVAALMWCMENVEAFRGFNTWVRPEIYGPEGEARLVKLSSISIIGSYHENPFHSLFGLGPGHTVDRLGGWMIVKYQSMLRPLGITAHPVSQQAWDAFYASWLGGKSSMFSPLFGWAGMWGDLGIVGLISYFLILGTIWTQICVDDLSKFLLLSVAVNGLIFSQMQEPGYMLYTVLIIGIRFQEKAVELSRRVHYR